MKHPFQSVLTNSEGTHLFTTSKSTIQVFSLTTGAVVGSWIDEVDVKIQLADKARMLKGRAKEEAKRQKREAKWAEKKGKKMKDNEGDAIKVDAHIYNYVRSLKLTKDEKHLVGTADSDKSAIIFEVDFESDNCLKLVKRQIFPKRPSAITFDGDDVLVADKFGDVFVTGISTPIEDEKTMAPILGHVSLLSDIVVGRRDGKKYVLSADRDEHIRVSNYPKSYVIDEFLFGHDEFISQLAIPDNAPHTLISGGGDDYVYWWNWHHGLPGIKHGMVCKVDVRKDIEAYLNDNHFPPERFIAEDSQKELTVAKFLINSNFAREDTEDSDDDGISTEHLDPDNYGMNDNAYSVIILCENTRAILVYHDDGYLIDLVDTIVTDHSIVDITIDHEGTIIAALDVDSGNLIQTFKKPDRHPHVHKYSAVVSEVAGKITANSTTEVDDKEDVYPLYHVKGLRKRSEH